MRFFKTLLIISLLSIATYGVYQSLSTPKKNNVQREEKKSTNPKKDPVPQINKTSTSIPASAGSKDFNPEKDIQKKDYTEILERIDQGKLDVDHKNQAGMTLLMQALDYDRPELAYALIERGANLLASDQSGTHILTQALLLGETEITKMALEKGADANTELDLIGSSLLMYAAQEGLNSEVKLLIQHGADVNHQNQRGETALMWASDMGQFTTSELLLNNKADPSLKNQDGLLARDLALNRGLEELAQLLRP